MVCLTFSNKYKKNQDLNHVRTIFDIKHAHQQIDSFNMLFNKVENARYPEKRDITLLEMYCKGIFFTPDHIIEIKKSCELKK